VGVGCVGVGVGVGVGGDVVGLDVAVLVSSVYV